MKKLIVLFAAIVFVSGLTTVNAQVSATATGTATVITPIAITSSGNMSFGNIAVSPTLSGTVVLSPAAVRTTGGSNGVTLPAVTGTVSAASFNVTGLGSSTYSITLPSSYIISDGASHSMTVDTFTSTPSSTGVLTSGAQTIKVGATLNVAAAQAAGTYTNAAGFPVQVNYN